MTIFYLHGFNSDGGGLKYDQLRRHFKTATVLAPDLPAHPLEVKAIVHQLLSENKAPYFFVGTSLGGFYAWYFSAITQSKAYLYNPSLSPNITLDDRGVGVFETWIKKRSYHFKREYLQYLKELKEEAKQKEEASLLHFFLGEEDDVIDHSQVPQLYPGAAFLRWYPNIGHRFSVFGETLNEW